MSEFNIKSAIRAAKARRTEKQQKEHEQLQVAGRLRMESRGVSERVNQAKKYEADILQKLEDVEQMPAGPLKTRQRENMYNRLGELAAEQGDYTRAVTLTVDPKRRKHYEKIKQAITIPDNRVCECPDDQIYDRHNKQEFTSPALMVSDHIVTRKGLKTLMVCRKCGFMNAR